MIVATSYLLMHVDALFISKPVRTSSPLSKLQPWPLHSPTSQTSAKVSLMHLLKLHVSPICLPLVSSNSWPTLASNYTPCNNNSTNDSTISTNDSTISTSSSTTSSCSFELCKPGMFNFCCFYMPH